jgi:membrane-associated phospholipid phosphatase
MPEWIQQIDDEVLHWLQEHHTAWWDYNLQQVVTLGSTTVVVLLSLFVIGLLLFDRQFTRAILVLILPIGAYFATDAIKDAVARPRPLVGQPPKRLSSSGSFPSGHSSMVMTGFLVAALALKEWWRRIGRRGVYPYAVAWAVAVASMVGLSRLYFGFHFLSDVIGGWLLGLAFALVFLGVDRLVRHWGKGPTPYRDGGKHFCSFAWLIAAANPSARWAWHRQVMDRHTFDVLVEWRKEGRWPLL